MAFFVARPDEIVAGNIQAANHFPKFFSVPVGEVPRRKPGRFGRFGDFGAVLIAAGRKKNIVTSQSAMTGDDVGLNRFKGESDMRRGVCVRDGRRNVKFVFLFHYLCISCISEKPRFPARDARLKHRRRTCSAAPILL